MSPSTLSRKRQTSSEFTISLPNKRRKIVPQRPTLRVDCSQPPRPLPQPIVPPFTAQLNWPTGFNFSPAYPFSLGQHHPSLQDWPLFPDVEFQQDGGNLAQNVDPRFLDACRTSVTSSCSWTTRRHASSQFSSVLMSSTVDSRPVDSQLGRDDVIATISARLDKLEHTVVAEVKAVEKMLVGLSQDLSTKKGMVAHL
jgi:hypothetical protein